METKKALFIVDMLNDFVKHDATYEGTLVVPGATGIVEDIQKLRQEADKQGIPVFYICDAHDASDVEFRTWPVHAVKGTYGAQVVDALAPRAHDIVVPKTRYSGFYKTNLDVLLQERGITEPIITGVCTEICDLATGIDAKMRDYNVTVVTGAIQALSQQNADAANVIYRTLGIQTRTTSQTLEYMARR